MTATRCLQSAALLGALALLVASCSTDPEQAKREYVESGDRFVAEKKYAEAIVQYRNALQQDARFGEARLKLAQTYEHLGDVQNTIREYIRAADALPSEPRGTRKGSDVPGILAAIRRRRGLAPRTR